MGLDPHRCSTKLSIGLCSPVALARSGQWHSYAGYKWLVAADHRSTSARMQELLSNYVSIALWLRTTLEWALTFRLISKSVIKYLSKPSTLGLPDHQRNSPRRILVPTQSSPKLALYHSQSVSPTLCVLSTLSSTSHSSNQ